MRLTELGRRMGETLGAARADTFARDQVIAGLGHRTVHEALAAGVPAKEVWRAVCADLDLPARLR